MRHGEPNHTCRICGKPYFACDTCDAKIGKTWRAVTCTAEHYDVFLALWKYTYGQMSEDGIKEILLDARANTWVNSPSYDLIIKLIGEPVAETASDAMENKEVYSTENVVYAPDHVDHHDAKEDGAQNEANDAEHVVVENAEEDKPVQQGKTASTYVKQNYYNGSNKNKKRHH
jgi:hypothetical protein